MNLENTLQGHEDRVWCISWCPTSPGGASILASASSDKKIKIWVKNANSNDWQCLCTLDDGHTKTIRHLAWSPQGNLLASASFDGSTCIWRREQNEGQLDFTCV